MNRHWQHRFKKNTKQATEYWQVGDGKLMVHEMPHQNQPL